MEGKSAGPLAPLEPLNAYHVLQKVELYECLQHLPEMEEYYNACEAYLNLPHSDENPLSLEWLREFQQSDKELVAKAEESGTRYHWRDFGHVKLVLHPRRGQSRDQMENMFRNRNPRRVNSLVSPAAKSPEATTPTSGDGPLLPPPVAQTHQSLSL